MAIGQVAEKPTIDISAVSMIWNDHIVVNIDGGERAIIAREVKEERRTDSEKGDIKGPNVFEGGFNSEDLLRTDEFFIKVGAPIERKKFENFRFNVLPQRRGEDKKESNVRKERNNKHVHKERTRGEREREEEKFISL